MVDVMEDTNLTAEGVVILCIGGFVLLNGIMNREWFMNHYKAAFFVKRLGRNGARVFYIILGLMFTIAGILLITGVIGPHSG
jgi:Immunity protein 17